MPERWFFGETILNAALRRYEDRPLAALAIFRVIAAVLFSVAITTPARADAILFVGTLASEGALLTIGGSVGRTFGGTTGFELDVARSQSGDSPSRRRITTFGGSLSVQSRPIARRLRLYGAGGVGVYGETTDDGRGSGAVAFGNIGGGTKITLAGPLSLRLDYRVLLLGDTSDSSPGLVVRRPQRLSAGIGLAF